jgi:hypothetical protein
MNSYEKKISFLNRYFIYKKIATVNAEKISIELIEESVGELAEKRKSTSTRSSNKSVSEPVSGKKTTNKTNEKQSHKKPTKTATIKSNKNTTSKITKSKPKIRKLNKLLILEDSGDSIQSASVIELEQDNIQDIDIEKTIMEKELVTMPMPIIEEGEKMEKSNIDELTNLLDNTEALPVDVEEKTTAKPSKAIKSSIKKKKVKLIIE